MAAKKKNGKNAGDAGSEKSRKVLIFCLLLALTLAFAVGVIWFCVRIPGALKNRNPRFTLRRVEVKSSGYWQGKDQELCSILHLNPGGDNLFAVDPAELRKRVLERMPNVDGCEIGLVLPDTLVVNLTERIPRAVLSSANGTVVVDAEGKFFKRKLSSAADRPLPVLHKFSRKRGMSEQCLPALKLLMTTIRDYPDIKIESIAVGDPDSLEVKMVYRDYIPCVALFAVREDYHEQINALQSAILSGEVRPKYDLRFKNQVVMPR